MSPFGAVRQTFSSARANRNFRLFLMGQFVSAIGTWMTFTATGWLVWQLTRSGAALGINAALQFGPMLVIGAFGGVLADRFDKRRILIVTQSLFAVVSVGLAVLVGTHVIVLWMVYTLSVVYGCITAIDNPSRQSFYVEMVGEGSLTNAVSLNSAAFTGARVIGPAIAGPRDRRRRHDLVLRARRGVVPVRARCADRDASGRVPHTAAVDAGARPHGRRTEVRLGNR